MTLAEAESLLEEDVPIWPTEALWYVGGRLVNVGPSVVPRTARAAYRTLWEALGHREATDLLRYVAQAELVARALDPDNPPTWKEVIDMYKPGL